MSRLEPDGTSLHSESVWTVMFMLSSHVHVIQSDSVRWSIWLQKSKFILSQQADKSLGQANTDIFTLFYARNPIFQELEDDLMLIYLCFMWEQPVIIQAVHRIHVSLQLVWPFVLPLAECFYMLKSIKKCYQLSWRGSAQKCDTISLKLVAQTLWQYSEEAWMLITWKAP